MYWGVHELKYYIVLGRMHSVGTFFVRLSSFTTVSLGLLQQVKSSSILLQ